MTSDEIRVAVPPNAGPAGSFDTSSDNDNGSGSGGGGGGGVRRFFMFQREGGVVGAAAVAWVRAHLVHRQRVLGDTVLVCLAVCVNDFSKLLVCVRVPTRAVGVRRVLASDHSVACWGGAHLAALGVACLVMAGACVCTRECAHRSMAPWCMCGGVC